jgi:hypothetical protein
LGGLEALAFLGRHLVREVDAAVEEGEGAEVGGDGDRGWERDCSPMEEDSLTFSAAGWDRGCLRYFGVR